MALRITRRWCLSVLNRYTLGLLVLCIGTVMVVMPHVRYDVTLFKQIVAADLKQIHQEMVDLYVNKKSPNIKMLLKMEELLHRLDERIKISVSTDHDHELTEKAEVDVCPDVYKGSKEGYPFYEKGWERTNCTNAKPIQSVLTILINTIAYSQQDEKHARNILKGIADTYPTVQVYIATRNNDLKKHCKKYKNVQVFMLGNSKRNSLAKTWNTLISKSDTPYVLVARDLVHFSWLSQLERQIRVVSETPKVAVAGGSYRNLTGQWKMGCFQTTLKNYILEYQEGYFYSRNECMFCDYLQGPFVAKKNMMTFDTTLQDEVIFDDLFLRLISTGNLLMGCPDAMYFTTDYSSYAKTTDRNVWIGLAKKWELNRVLLPHAVKHSFSCNDIGFKCNKKITEYYLLPVCCLELYAEAVKFFQIFSEQHNISFELDTGSVLGSVKYDGLLPWDVDGDLSVLSSDMRIFGEKKTVDHFKKHGYELRDFRPPKYDTKKGLFVSGYVTIQIQELGVELWGMPALTNMNFLPPDLKKNCTKTNIRGAWVNTVFNPGMFVRNRYGIEILKHAQSWIYTGLENSFSWYVGGSFKKCKNPEHHACLQNFPSDGNIPFLVP